MYRTNYYLSHDLHVIPGFALLLWSESTALSAVICRSTSEARHSSLSVVRSEVVGHVTVVDLVVVGIGTLAKPFYGSLQTAQNVALVTEQI